MTDIIVWLVLFLSFFVVCFILPFITCMLCQLYNRCSACLGIDDEQYTINNTTPPDIGDEQYTINNTTPPDIGDEQYTINNTTPPDIGDVQLEFLRDSYPMHSNEQGVTRLEQEFPNLELISITDSDLPPTYEDATFNNK